MMLRALSTVITEMQEAMLPFAAAHDCGADAVYLHDAYLKLPLDFCLIFEDGQAQLLADVPRSLSDSHWHSTASTLAITLEPLAVQELV